MDDSRFRGYRTERGTVGGLAAISTGNHRATTAGLGVLMRGGKAFDGAVAAEAAWPWWNRSPATWAATCSHC